MQSVREAAGRNLRIRAPLTLRSLAGELALPPASTLDVLDHLEQHQVTRTSGSLTPATVKGSATILFTSDGFWSLGVHVHENSFLAHNWSLVAVPHVVDAGGGGFAFAASGKATDQRDSDILQEGWDPRISAHWDQLRDAPVTFDLDVDVNVGHLLGLALKGLLAVLPVATLALFAAGSGPVETERNPDGSMTHRRVL